MIKIVYCKNCLLPNTRPNIYLDKKSTLCSVCKPLIKRNFKINWKKRLKEFANLIEVAKKKNSKYDCVIPVSGGKDSTWQVITALKYKLKPLCVTWKTPARNTVGENNLKNLIKLGVDHIDFSINPKVEKIFITKTFKKLGNPLIPMHMALHAIPLQIAINMKIPLVIWGENSADEYGGKKFFKGSKMTNKWRKIYGVTNGTKATDWKDKDLSIKSLSPYILPSQKKIKTSKVKEIFLGYYFRWDPKKIFKVSKSYGFKKTIKPKTGYYNFADIDDEFLITIHHFMKWYKFGFTRLWDNLSIEIRNKRISRKNAIKKVKKIGIENPKMEIKKFCNYLGISQSKFYDICNIHRNKKIWFKENNKWKINNFLIKNWYWNKK